MSSYYSNLLQRAEWQKRRLEILKRDNFKCQSSSCKTLTPILEIHHIDYISGINPWDYPNDMLISLCQVCHKKENQRFTYEQNLLTALKMKGYLVSDLIALTTLIYQNKRAMDILTEEVKGMQKTN